MKLVALLLLSLAIANARVLYTRTVPALGWTRSREGSIQEKVTFQLALRKQNVDKLEKIFWEVSDPDHVNYQKFLTPAEIQALVSPPAAEHQRVVDWLLESGIKAENIKSFGDSIKASTTVLLAARMFSTSFFQYVHSDGRRLVAAHGDYSIPAHLDHIVEMVTGLSHFPVPHLKWHKGAVGANAADYGIIPQTLTGLYNIRPVTPGSALNTSQGVIEFEEQNFSPTDLDNYGKDLGIQIPPVSDDHVVGPNDPSAPSTEGQLDIEVIAGVNPESDNWFWFNSPSTKWLYEWITEFNAAADVPTIISVSYAWWEGDQCNPGISGDACSQLGVDSYGYARLVNQEFMKSGTRGVSILVASGDSGTNGRTDPDCTIPKLRPDFPACSPYVTSVGATELINAQPLPNPPAICKSSQFSGGCAKSGTEQAVSYRISNYASGGGFSNTAAQPSYQAAAVKAYLSGGTPLPPASYYNASGRAFPDIAALGHQCVVIQYGQAEGVGGTSCAAPFVAGIFGLLNQESYKLYGKPLGFLNPLIYKMFAADPTIFQDITVGDNKCTEEGCSSSCKGFNAAKGWDPVTGVGTPNFAKILKYIQTHPPASRK